MLHNVVTTSFLVASLMACASSSGAGTLGPDGDALRADDGSALPLAEIVARHDATVLIWWASTCPCVKRYAERVAELAKRHGGDQVAFLYVSSNADDDLAIVRAASAQAPIPMARDDGGGLARHFGVISTPSVVVIDRAGRVRFHGWIDNEHTVGDSAREPWLDETLDALVAGTADTLRRTPVWGCTVTRSLSQPGRCHTPPAPAPAPPEEMSTSEP